MIVSSTIGCLGARATMALQVMGLPAVDLSWGASARAALAARALLAATRPAATLSFLAWYATCSATKAAMKW